MKVLTRHVIIDDKDYALITDTQNGQKYYGTICYDNVDENGTLTKRLTGYDMAVSLVSAADAIQNRIDQNKVEKFKAEGHALNEVLAFVACGYTADAAEYNEMCESFKPCCEVQL